MRAWKTTRWFFYSLVFLGILIWMGILIPNQPSRIQYPLRGIDVSHHNGEIEWSAVASSGCDFVFIKATEGSHFKDPRFNENWLRARENGIICGAYHFFSTSSSGIQQANNFIEAVPRMPSMLPPVIDVEFSRLQSQMTGEEFLANLRILCSHLEQHYGVAPIIYTTQEFHLDYLKDQKIERLWVRAIVGWPYDLAKNWLFWQYSNRGRVKGIKGKVDLNVFRGSRKEFESLLVPGQIKAAILDQKS